ncbi:hypothetical protein [Paraburkholderia caballeronis]|uniref:hypothetical protein n=1 Tax=Paraburkholderia caballeronis TaxID=416943 RepID=UPI00106522A8|nr:hypothetical protein [Paraburkholderia caballeronis]
MNQEGFDKMERSGTPAQTAEQSCQQVAPLVRVSEAGWFHIRFEVKKGNAASQGAFIAQTLPELRVLLRKGNGEQPILHLFSQKFDKTFALRRVVAYRALRNTNMHMFELEDGHSVLWCSSSDEEGPCAEVDELVAIGRLADISSLSTHADSAARENDERSTNALGDTQRGSSPP